MGKLGKQTARKQWKCGRCGKIIARGEVYYSLKFNYSPIRRRCLQCGFKSWEYTSSPYLLALGRLYSTIDRNTTVDEDIILSIKDELDEIRNEIDNGIDNLPISLIYSQIGMKLEDRKNNLEYAIEEIENLDAENCEKKELADIIYNLLST